MAELLYTAEAISTGAGRNGHVRTTDGRVDLDLATPTELGGSGNGANPELLFAAGYAACFHNALQSVARIEKVALHDSAVGARVRIIRDETDGGFRLAVLLEVTIPDLDRDRAEKLMAAAHRRCPYSKATTGNIAVDLVLNQD